MTVRHTLKVKIIKVGTITQEASEITSIINLEIKSDLGIGGGSTVTLIKATQNILVDTGYDYEWIDTKSNNKQNNLKLTRALQIHGISPAGIDIVFVTHWHRDDYGNLGLFKNARFMAAKPLVKRFRLNNFIGTDDGEEIGDGVKAVFTPGHTIDHASILIITSFKGIKTRIAVAGDAVISHSYFQMGRIWRYNTDFYDTDEAKKSIIRVIGLSDVIIPGHGVPFMTYKPDWL
jgi:glyoxylase-like metal-dependent hydrolase (beta-lactamase superfamily II)